MSFLAPLYALGALSIGLPILFHLIRRRPRSEAEFSSLMFLTQSPPRLTQRSRLDQLPLLLLRALAVLLLALAFSRPFLRSEALLQQDAPSRRIVMLVDTSASMQRADLWDQALAAVNETIDDLSPRDQVGLLAFDSAVRTIVPLESSDSAVDAGQAELLRSATKELAPSNAGTDLGAALITAADCYTTRANKSAKRLRRRDTLCWSAICRTAAICRCYSSISGLTRSRYH